MAAIPSSIAMKPPNIIMTAAKETQPDCHIPPPCPPPCPRALSLPTSSVVITVPLAHSADQRRQPNGLRVSTMPWTAGSGISWNFPAEFADHTPRFDRRVRQAESTEAWFTGPAALPAEPDTSSDGGDATHAEGFAD